MPWHAIIICYGFLCWGGLDDAVSTYTQEAPESVDNLVVDAAALTQLGLGRAHESWGRVTMVTA